MIDLVETEEIKEQIKENPSNLEKIIAEASMGICVTNQEANFVLVNDNYCQIYGYEREELVGQPFTIVVPKESKEKMDLLHQKFLRDKQEIARTWQVQNKDKSLINISVDAAYSEDILDQTPHKITFIHLEE